MNDRDMTNKVALITGGAGGLGRELAGAFYESAYRVAVNYHASEEQAREIIAPMGSAAMAVRADVGVYDDVLKMAETIGRQWGRVDVLVNNAGITRDALLIRQREDDWDRIIGVNLKGAFNTVKAFAPLMAGGGHIVNISSCSGMKGKEGQAAYSASKAALLGFTRTAAMELAGQGIKVNAVLPGYMSTQMGASAAGALKKACENSLLHSLSDPKEVARFIVYLSGTENISGQVFCLDSRII